MIFVVSPFKILLVNDHGGIVTSSLHVVVTLWQKSCSVTLLSSQFECIVVDSLFVLIGLDPSTQICSVLPPSQK